MKQIILTIITLCNISISYGQDLQNIQEKKYIGTVITSKPICYPEGVVVKISGVGYELQAITDQDGKFYIENVMYPFDVKFEHNDILGGAFTVENTNDNVFIVDLINSTKNRWVSKNQKNIKVNVSPKEIKQKPEYPSYDSSPYGKKGYKGVVLLGMSDILLEDVVVTITGKTELNTTTNKKGEFIIPDVKYPFKVTFEHAGTEKMTLAMTKHMEKDNIFILSSRYSIEVTKNIRVKTRGYGGAARRVSLSSYSHMVGIKNELGKVPGLKVSGLGDLSIGWGSRRQSYRSAWNVYSDYESGPLIVIDGWKWAGVSNIHSLPIDLEEIKTMEVLDPQIAAMYYGSKDGGRGAIVIHTKSGRR